MADFPHFERSEGAEASSKKGEDAARPESPLMRRIQAEVEDLNALQGWRTTPEQRALFLVTEVGEAITELLKLTAALSGDESASAEKIRERLGLELYDILWNVCDLANMFDIDLDDAANKKRQRNRGRSWTEPYPDQ